MSLIDTYHIATMGQNSINTFTLASNGILIFVTIEPEPPTPEPEDRPSIGGFLPNGLARNVRKKTREKRKDQQQEEECPKQKITVTAIIGGKEYIETITVECRPELSIDDVDVQINEIETRPKIKILLKS